MLLVLIQDTQLVAVFPFEIKTLIIVVPLLNVAIIIDARCDITWPMFVAKFKPWD